MIRVAGAALAVSWVAQETICVGQALIRTAYGWLRWAEQHLRTREPLQRQSPSEAAQESDTAGCHTPREETYSATKS